MIAADYRPCMRVTRGGALPLEIVCVCAPPLPRFPLDFPSLLLPFPLLKVFPTPQPLSKANGPASPTAALQNLNGTVLHIPHLLTHTTTCSSRSLLSPPWPPAPWPLVPTVARKFTIRAVSPQCTHVRYIISFVCCFFETRFMRRDYDTMDKSENLA